MTADEKSSHQADWVRNPERSNMAVLKLMTWLSVKLGRSVARWLLVPISLYFLCFSPKAMRHSRRFLARALGRQPTWRDQYRHVHVFASTLLDRVYLLREGLRRFDVSYHGHEALLDAAREDPGAFLVGGHLGSFEVLRALGDRLGGMKVALVMYADNARRINEALQALIPDRPMPIIALGQVSSMLAVRDWLDNGGLAGMLGDRGLESAQTTAEKVAGTASGVKFVVQPFLGVNASFVDGPMRMAALLKRRVFFMVGLFQGGNRYEVVFKPIADFRQLVAAQREAAVEEAVRAYARELEHFAGQAPYNWFNFHDFWHEDVTPIGAKV